MADFGDRFVNLAHRIGISDEAPLPVEDLSVPFLEAVDHLLGLVPQGGGTIYLRPGRWRLGGAVLVSVPPTITLMVAPGALIVPLPPEGRFARSDVVHRPSVQILGGLEAPTSMFLSTSVYEGFFVSVDDPAGAVPDAGWVSLPTAAVTAVYPDWWGGGRFPGIKGAMVDHASCEAALRGALFRWEWTETGGDRAPSSPLVIEVRSRLRLSEPLRLGERTWSFDGDSGSTPQTFSMSGLLLRGRRRDEPSLSGLATRSGRGRFLLEFTAPKGLRIEDLHLDTGTNFSGVVDIDLGEGNGERELTFSGCTFSGACDNLVAVRAATAPTVPPTEGSPSSGASDVAFSACVWRPSPIEARPGVGLRVAAPYRTVTVRDANLVGEARRMIQFDGGSLRVDVCSFHNAAVPGEWYATDPKLRPPVPESGVDIDVSWLLAPPGRLWASACNSASLQFLARERLYRPTKIFLSGLAPCNAVITALQHRMDAPAVAPTPPSRPTFPASIFWTTSLDATSTLTFLAGRLDPGPTNNPFRGRVAVDELGQQSIYDAWLLPAGTRYSVWRYGTLVRVYSLGYRVIWGDVTI
ncbi:MAG: hypothetical protein R3A52_21245 [Polyangiales bacterium]